MIAAKDVSKARTTRYLAAQDALGALLAAMHRANDAVKDGSRTFTEGLADADTAWDEFRAAIETADDAMTDELLRLYRAEQDPMTHARPGRR